MRPYRIVLADDHVLMRQGLKKILGEKEEFTVVGEAGDGLELLALIEKTDPDMVMLDVNMPNLSGFDAAIEIRKAHPDIKILIFTMHKKEEYLSQALAANVDGYLLKENCDTDLFEAINKIRNGKKYISPCMSDVLLESWINGKRREGIAPPVHESLSARENEIMNMLTNGKSNKEIASFLDLSVRTVEYHRARLMKKLKLKTIAELIKYSLQEDKSYKH